MVNSFREKSGAQICIEGSGQQERIITVNGPMNSIIKAYLNLPNVREKEASGLSRIGRKERQRGSELAS